MPESEVKIQHDQSSDVAVKGDPPVLARIEIKPELPSLVSIAEGLAKAPTTTAEEDLHSRSQRNINLIWEWTQSFAAGVVVLTTCIAVLVKHTLPAEWWTILGLVIGFYFGRTNHQRVGGIQLGR